MDDYPAREERGVPWSETVVLASGTGVTDAAITIASSVVNYYIVIDQIYMSCGSDYTKANFTLNFVGQKEFVMEYDETGVLGIAPPWAWMNILNPNPAANTTEWWITREGLGGSFVMEPTGDSVKIVGRDPMAGENYTSTSGVALTITLIGRKIHADDYY